MSSRKVVRVAIKDRRYWTVFASWTLMGAIFDPQSSSRRPAVNINSCFIVARTWWSVAMSDPSFMQGE